MPDPAIEAKVVEEATKERSDEKADEKADEKKGEKKDGDEKAKASLKNYFVYSP
jgi:hypothetical protein